MNITRTINLSRGPETWETDGDLHCPGCGKREVWTNPGRDDYYQGEPHLCLGCGSVFYMPVSPHTDEDFFDSLVALRQP